MEGISRTRLSVEIKPPECWHALADLENAGAAVVVADVLEQRVGRIASAASAATLLSVAARRAESDSGAGGRGGTAGAFTSASVCREWHLLAEVTGHLRYL